MAAISTSQLKAILAAEKADALGATTSSKLSEERSRALDYYLGDVSKDIPSEAGKSKAVSSDVADTIEGLMPSLMEIFAGGDEVVRFMPVGPEDVEASEQETDYVNHVFMQQNPGFMVLYSFIKDALLSKVGVVKVWTEEETRDSEETFYGQTEDTIAVMLERPNTELVAHTPNEDGTSDVTLRCVKTVKKQRVVPVPPEEFGISRRAKSVHDATYCFHETVTTVGELIAKGYDEKQVRAIPSATIDDNTESQSRSTVDEFESTGDEGMNTAARPVTVTEHYTWMDYNGDGKPRMYRVVTGGSSGDVLRIKGKPDVSEVECAPFAAMTPVIITHRFFGRSVADLVIDIMQIKTALLRGMLNNLYLHNNPRVVVSSNGVTDETLDDLLTSRPGGIVRVKGNVGESIAWQNVPDITGSIYPALEYFDATREWRTGVTRQGQGIDANALQNQSATAVNQAFTASQARMKLIARIFAETGVRDLFLLLHREIRKHGNAAGTVRLRGKWVTVDPKAWREREDLTIDVGLGTGGKQEQLAGVMALVGLQKEALIAGKTNLVNDQNLFNSAKEMVKLVGKKDAELFFTDPSTQPPPQPQPDPKMMELQAKAQLDQQKMMMQAEIEKMQAEADIATQDRKTQADMVLAEKKFQLDRELKMLDAQIKVQQHHDELAVGEKRGEQEMKYASRKMRFEKNSQRMVDGDDLDDEGNIVMSPEIGGLLKQLLEMQVNTHKAITAPKRTRLVRDPATNKVIGAESLPDANQ